MLKQLDTREFRARARVVAALVCVPFFATCGFFRPICVLAQSGGLTSAGEPVTLPDIRPSIVPKEAKEKRPPLRLLSDRLPEKPTVEPSFRIPVDALGFTAPGPGYLGYRYSMCSLDFLDNDRLLFTFRVPGLIRRENGHKPGEDERQIRAVVVDVKTGRVEAEALWTLHDRARYLWMLKDGTFLLRDRDSLQQGNRALVLKPFLQFPGPIDWLELDPQQLYMVTNSHEPPQVEPKPGQVDSPPNAAAKMEVDGQNDSAPPNTVVRILERSTGKVMLVSRVRATVHLPINADGYLEGLRGNGQAWLLNLNYFKGGSRILGRFESSCVPDFNFVSQSEFLVKACIPSGGTRLSAFRTDGSQLWNEDTSSLAIWPITVMSPDGSRMAHETLEVSHSVSAYNPIDASDVKGQLVRIINVADGSVALEASANPPLDVGGNVAISPSGQRVAILTNGAVQVFDLPPAPALPKSTAAPAARQE